MAAAMRLLSKNLNTYLLKTHCINYKGARNLLTESFSCESAWEQRLNTPTLQKIEAANFALKLQEKMDRDGSASGLDLDILANKLDQIDKVQLDFVETLFARFRKSRRCTETVDSLSYGIIRSLLKLDETDRLLRILDDKLTYGVFLNNHAAALCMNHFIKNDLYLEAGQIAVELMLQEDLGSPLTHQLAWYSAHLAWKNIPLSELEPAPPAPTDDDEEVWKKVSFIQNPWYDDHFDIPTEGRKIGKTMVLLTHGAEDTLHLSYRLVGYGLWQKMEEGLSLLADALSSKTAVSGEALEYFGQCIENIHTQERPEEPIEPGLLRLHHQVPFFTAEEKQRAADEYQNLKTTLEAENLTSNLDLAAEIKSNLDTAVKDHADADCAEQERLLDEWNSQREAIVQGYIDEAKKKQLKISIAERLKKLTETEERLRFFEEEDKIHLGVSRYKPHRPITTVTEEEQFVAAPQERGKML